MGYIIINSCVLIGLILFYFMRLKDLENIDTSEILGFFMICFFQSVLCILSENIIYAGNILKLVERLYDFSVYYLVVCFFGLVCAYGSSKLHPTILVGKIILSLIIFYFIFFTDDASYILISDASRGKLIQIRILFQVLILLYFVILIFRARYAITPLVRHKYMLITFLFVCVFTIFELFVFTETKFSFVYKVFSIITFVVLIFVYNLHTLDYIVSVKKGFEHFGLFISNYVVFGTLITFSYVVSLTAFSSNSTLALSIATIISVGLFFVQYLTRNALNTYYENNTPRSILENYFEFIDYSAKRESLYATCANLLKRAVDASSIDLYTLEGDTFLSVYSLGGNTSVKLPKNDFVFSRLAERENLLIVKNKLNLKVDSDIELLELLTQCNAEIMIFVRGDRGIISAFSFGQKVRAIQYSAKDIELLEAFYPNFFVFGYYLETSRKKELMDIIGREIEFSGQVIESIYKNIEAVTMDNVDVGYLSQSLRNLGGDFIDLIRLTPTKHMFVIGDVSGRGLNASMSMIILKTFIRSFLAESQDFIGLINTLNKFIKQNLPRGTFFAGTFFIYDNSDNMLYYINCGVAGILLYSKAYNNVIEIQGEGKVLGFVNDVSKLLCVKKLQLELGDIIFTCTDGVIESLSVSGEEYGKKRIENQIIENKMYPSQNMCTFLYNDLLSFTARGISDDVSMLILKIVQ